MKDSFENSPGQMASRKVNERSSSMEVQRKSDRASQRYSVGLLVWFSAAASVGSGLSCFVVPHHCPDGPTAGQRAEENHLLSLLATRAAGQSARSPASPFVLSNVALSILSKLFCDNLPRKDTLNERLISIASHCNATRAHPARSLEL